MKYRNIGTICKYIGADIQGLRLYYPHMITLHHCISARSFRPLWMLEELELPYKLVMLPFPPRIKDRAFLQLNPLGTVPLLTHGEVQMTESAAICAYLCALKSPTSLEVERDEADFGAYLNFLDFGEATLTFPLTLVLRYSKFEPEERRNEVIAGDYAKWFLSRLRSLERRLERSDYLCAGRFTAADVSVGYALMLASSLNLDDQFLPSTRRYWERLRERTGFECARMAEMQAAVSQNIPVIPATEYRP